MMKLYGACGCHMGKIRKNNEDNLLFDGKDMSSDNKGLEEIWTLEWSTERRRYDAVFDGMGGENFGELASFSAAEALRAELPELLASDRPVDEEFKDLSQRLNLAVVAEKERMLTTHMGTTMVSFCFEGDTVWACNLGDSRAYRLRDGVLTQLSEDHVEKWGNHGKKAPLTQHLGIEPEEMLLEPTVVSDRMQDKDQYLLCSDGVTDMLTDEEIAEILGRTGSVEECVKALIAAALDNGGRDNITAILYRVSAQEKAAEPADAVIAAAVPVPQEKTAPQEEPAAPEASAAQEAPSERGNTEQKKKGMSGAVLAALCCVLIGALIGGTFAIRRARKPADEQPEAGAAAVAETPKAAEAPAAKALETTGAPEVTDFPEAALIEEESGTAQAAETMTGETEPENAGPEAAEAEPENTGAELPPTQGEAETEKPGTDETEQNAASPSALPIDGTDIIYIDGSWKKNVGLQGLKGKKRGSAFAFEEPLKDCAELTMRCSARLFPSKPTNWRSFVKKQWEFYTQDTSEHWHRLKNDRISVTPEGKTAVLRFQLDPEQSYTGFAIREKRSDKPLDLTKITFFITPKTPDPTAEASPSP